MEGVKQAVAGVVKRVAVVVDLVAFTAFHLGCTAKEFAESGFGVPKLITTTAGLSVLGCAFAGHTSLAFDVVTKIYGKRECKTCNGWEGIRCTACRGTGNIQYLIVNTGETSTAENAITAVTEGRAQIKSAPGSTDLGYSLPSKECTICSGTGVMRCTECNGDAWVPGFHTERLLNAPRRALNAFKKLHVPDEPLLESLEDPATAEFYLFTEPELKYGEAVDEDTKREMWWHYEKWRNDRLTRKAVSNQEPGWETMQQVLVATDPLGTLENPSIVKNVSYHKARKAVEAEVQNMPMPPRPTDWKVPINYPLKESDWTEEDLKDPQKKKERDILLEAQANVANEFFDAAWEREWRERTIQELTRQKIDTYIKRLNVKEQPQAKAATPGPRGETTAPAKPSSKAKPAELSKEEKKKKERRERAERIAKQAAEREAALKKSKGK